MSGIASSKNTPVMIGNPSGLPSRGTVWRTLAAEVWFHMRNLLSTSFFLETAIASPLSFALLKILAAHWQVTSTLWFEAAASGLWATTTLAVGIIGFQRFQGVMQYLAVSVLPEWAVFLPVVGAAALIGLIGLPISLAVVIVFVLIDGGFDMTLADAGSGTGTFDWAAAIGPQIIGYLLALLACCASAALLSGIFVLSRQAIAFEPLILIPIWLLCGIVVPVSAFPAPLRWLAFLHPLTSAVFVAQRPAWDTTALAGAIGCVTLSAVYLACAAIGLRVALRRAREEGTLDLS